MGDDHRLGRIYAERNACAVALARMAILAGFSAGQGIDSHEDRDPEYRHVLYVDLPNGRQVSFHILPQEIHLLEGIPEYRKPWTGANTKLGKDWCIFPTGRGKKE